MNHLHKNSLSVGCTTTSAAKSARKRSSSGHHSFGCGMCEFGTNLKLSFDAHILIHRSPRYGNSFQCKSCGVSFAAEQSWKTHMLLVHKVKRPRAEEYCADIR
jgi:hypothetical protein